MWPGEVALESSAVRAVMLWTHEEPQAGEGRARILPQGAGGLWGGHSPCLGFQAGPWRANGMLCPKTLVASQIP